MNAVLAHPAIALTTPRIGIGSRLEMDADAIEGRIVTLYGRVDWRRATGPLHVAAIEAERHHIIALGSAAPRSPTDRFVLGFARARADAILTTGEILRSEPDLVHRYAEDADTEAGFAGWRVRVLGRPSPPVLIVLSGSDRFDPAHPALAAAPGGFVWTSPAGRRRLPERIGALEVRTLPESSGPGAEDDGGRGGVLRRALREAALGTVLVEAGPGTAEALYPDPEEAPVARRPESGAATVDAAPADPAAVVELLLSRFEGRLADAALGPAFVSPRRLRSRLGPPRSSLCVDEPSGRWRFERFRAGGPAASSAPSRSG